MAREVARRPNGRLGVGVHAVHEADRPRALGVEVVAAETQLGRDAAADVPGSRCSVPTSATIAIRVSRTGTSRPRTRCGRRRP
jgi:hypothetical protein